MKILRLCSCRSLRPGGRRSCCCWSWWGWSQGSCQNRRGSLGREPHLEFLNVNYVTNCRLSIHNYQKKDIPSSVPLLGVQSLCKNHFVEIHKDDRKFLKQSPPSKSNFIAILKTVDLKKSEQNPTLNVLTKYVGFGQNNNFLICLHSTSWPS